MDQNRNNQSLRETTNDIEHAGCTRRLTTSRDPQR